MAPTLRERFQLSLGQAGVLISASLVGSLFSLIPWGLATDRCRGAHSSRHGPRLVRRHPDWSRLGARVLDSFLASRPGWSDRERGAGRQRTLGHALVRPGRAGFRARHPPDRDSAEWLRGRAAAPDDRWCRRRRLGFAAMGAAVLAGAFVGGRFSASLPGLIRYTPCRVGDSRCVTAGSGGSRSGAGSCLHRNSASPASPSSTSTTAADSPTAMTLWFSP